MVREETEKMLGANLPIEYVRSFWKAAYPPANDEQDELPHGFKILIIRAMANLWSELPLEVRESYMYPDKKKIKPLNLLVGQIVSEQLATIREALSPHQKKIVDQKIKETKEKIHQAK